MPGLRKFGVPPGGAFDRESRLLAAAVVGADVDAECLEVATTAFGDQPFLTAICEEEGMLSIVGMDCTVQVDGKETPRPFVRQVTPGQELRISAGKAGMRVYLAGADRITFNDDTLTCESVEKSWEGRRRIARQQSLRRGQLRYIPLSEDLHGHEFTVANEINRIGLRLTGGPTLNTDAGQSEPSVPGAIQAIEGGLLVHGPDGPTVGGYRKVGVVIQADLDKVGQLRPGQLVSFAQVSMKAAREAWIEQNHQLERLRRLVRILTTME
jgi:allophanate hydrolase subunit 2